MAVLDAKHNEKKESVGRVANPCVGAAASVGIHDAQIREEAQVEVKVEDGVAAAASHSVSNQEPDPSISPCYYSIWTVFLSSSLLR